MFEDKWNNTRTTLKLCLFLAEGLSFFIKNTFTAVHIGWELLQVQTAAENVLKELNAFNVEYTPFQSEQMRLKPDNVAFIVSNTSSKFPEFIKSEFFFCLFADVIPPIFWMS